MTTLDKILIIGAHILICYTDLTSILNFSTDLYNIKPNVK